MAQAAHAGRDHHRVEHGAHRRICRECILPASQRALRADAAATQWVVNVYLLLLGAFVLIGGRLPIFMNDARFLYS